MNKSIKLNGFRFEPAGLNVDWAFLILSLADRNTLIEQRTAARNSRVR